MALLLRRQGRNQAQCLCLLLCVYLRAFLLTYNDLLLNRVFLVVALIISHFILTFVVFIFVVFPALNAAGSWVVGVVVLSAYEVVVSESQCLIPEVRLFVLD